MPASMARQWRDAVSAVPAVLQIASVQATLSGQGLFASGSLLEEFGAQVPKEVGKEVGTMRRVSRFARIKIA